MRKLYYFVPLICIATVFIYWLKINASIDKHHAYSKSERIEGYIEDMIFTSRDVDLGYIPYDKLFKAMDEGNKRLEQSGRSRQLPGSLTSAIFRERGPNNIGGRTRAILIDEGDPNRNRIWIGSVSGGLWRTEDITQGDPQWEKLALDIDNLSIGSIAQDPNNLGTVYVGTGEGFPNQDAITGAGIFKTTDDGATWTWLPSTKISSFENVHEMHVHTNGDVFAGTEVGGLFRSKDGGNSWEKVLGTSLSGATSNNFYDFEYNEENQFFYAANSNSVFKSPTGNRGDWTDIGRTKPGFPQDLVRCELAVCASNPEVMYVLGSVNGAASNTYVSNNGGTTWTSRSSPGDVPSGDFTNGQAWYDLDIGVDPFNCGRIIAGGVPLFESGFQGISWQPFGQGQIHVDQHNITFDPKLQGRILLGNDGGIWLTENGGQNILNRNSGYVTTQFYAGAIHPGVGSPYLLGGTQDNNSLQITEAGLSPANSVKGGDGVFCFIDQNEPDIQIVSSQGGNYSISFDGGLDFNDGIDVAGSFINRSGYDDEANLLYGQVDGADYFRWDVQSGFVENVDIQGQGLDLSAIKADPNTPNRVYFGGQSGRVVRVDDANTGTTVQGTLVANLGGSSVSCIYLDKQNANHILVSLFNFGANLKNIYITYDGGTEWISIEGDLPDMPVRWAIFDPANHDRVMIATEAGVWVTDDVDGSATHWEPIAPANGMPYVKVSMLLLRDSDKVVMAATHGRGLFTTDVFSAPAPVILAQPIAYEGHPITIDGSQSVNAQSFEWDLGDNTTSQESALTHTYEAPGVYNIILKINGSVADTQVISVLPYLPAPYKPGDTDYAGDFDSKPEHFASHIVSGTGFQRGASTIPGKDGTHSGTSAWVLGINNNLYQNNTRAELYTPMFDLSEPGLYELKFFGKHAVENLKDGYQLEYSLDAGQTWIQLGHRDNPNWYNYYNANISDGAFPQGKSYFTNAQLDWASYAKDISFLAGEPNVSFRYIFRSNEEEQAQGLAIDDFEITRYEGELVTTLTVFEGSYTGDQEITVNWTTGIEYHCQRFQLERSFGGIEFDSVAVVPAKGVVSSFSNSYTRKDQNLHDVIYYRLKVTNIDTNINYFYEFYSDTIVVRRDVEPNMIYNAQPNPFYDRVGISFSSIINEEITARLFDCSGKLIREDITIPNAASYLMEDLRLPVGIYVLSVRIGDGETRAFKLLSYRDE